MSKQSVSEIIDSWETHGLQNLHEISLDRIYAFPLTRKISTYEKVYSVALGSLWHLKTATRGNQGGTSKGIDG